jgi:transposase
MSNSNANFEMTGILLGQEVRKRKTPQEKSPLSSRRCSQA